MRIAVVSIVVLGAGAAHAQPASDAPPPRSEPAQLRPQLQADLGLSVIYAAYERPIAAHVAISVGAGIFGTYFLPWFDRGQDVKGVGIGVRPTWFAHDSGRGLYVAPYLRVVGVRGDNHGDTGTGVGFATGAFVGWSFALTDKLDLRIGAGAQYIRFRIDTDANKLGTSTPFLAADLLLGYRL